MFDQLDELGCEFDELAKISCCKFDELDELDELDKLRMSSMSLIS